MSIAPAPESAYHVYEWRYLSGTYTFFVDDVLQATSLSSYRPTGFFFGHPPRSFCGWTSQQIDFVDIRSGTPTAARTTSWGKLKAIYR